MTSHSDHSDLRVKDSVQMTQSEVQDQAKAPPTVSASPSDGAGWVLIGFLGFGSVLGFIAGASETAGIGQSLLTSLLSFVGGGLLALVGFVFKNDETPQIRARATGQALFGLALGVWLGLGIGIKLRLNFEAQEDQRILLYAREAARAPTATAPMAPAAGDQPAPTTSGSSASDVRPLPPKAASPTQPLPAPARHTLLHADTGLCSTYKRRIPERIAAGYYEAHPDAKADDELSKKEACGQ